MSLKNLFEKFFKKQPAKLSVPPVIIAPAPRVAVKQESAEPPTEQTIYFDEAATGEEDLGSVALEHAHDVDSVQSAELTIIEEEPVELRLALKGPAGNIDLVLSENNPIVTLGRSKEENDIVIDDSRASRTHCRLVLNADEKEIFVEDLGSSNGTKINGEKIEAIHIIIAGDTLTIGRTEHEVSFLS